MSQNDSAALFPIILSKPTGGGLDIIRDGHFLTFWRERELQRISLFAVIAPERGSPEV